MRIRFDHGVPGPAVSLGHFVEQLACVSEGPAFGVGLDGAVEEEDGRSWGEGDEVRLELAGFEEGAGGGAEVEEVGVEGEVEGEWGGEEEGDGFAEVAGREVGEDGGGGGFGFGWVGGFGEVGFVVEEAVYDGAGFDTHAREEVMLR